MAWGWFALSALGLVLAHMSNNLMNDLFDLEVGTDREDYPRNLYSPHPVLSGVVTRRQLATYALVVNFVCLAIMIVLTVARGWPIVAFALGGFLLSAAYTAPPLRLKKHGLGEPTVLVVWGPLMVGGTYYAATGQIPGAVILASLPYALLCTTVLMGKHIDKIPWDGPDGTHTLPVILGEARARAVTKVMFVGFYASIVALVIARVLPVASLLVFASLPIMVRTWKAYSRAEAGGLADTEPGVAAVVRGDVVPRDPPRGRVVRARLDRRRHPRLVTSGGDAPADQHLRSGHDTEHDAGLPAHHHRDPAARTPRVRRQRVRHVDRWRRAPRDLRRGRRQRGPARGRAHEAGRASTATASARSAGTRRSTSRRTSRSRASARCCTR